MAPGIGKKIAQRVIYELKDKIAKESAGALPAIPAGVQTAVPGTDKLADAAAALGVLGYGAAEINSALRGVDAVSYTHLRYLQKSKVRLKRSWVRRICLSFL